jgi:hypothetical protein
VIARLTGILEISRPRRRSGNRVAPVLSMLRLISVVALLAVAVGCRTNETPEQQVHDAEITANLKTKLASDLGASTVTNISVNVTNGVVSLSGTVHNSEERAKAIAIAQAIQNVVKVNDNLQVVSAQAP